MSGLAGLRVRGRGRILPGLHRSTPVTAPPRRVSKLGIAIVSAALGLSACTPLFGALEGGPRPLPAPPSEFADFAEQTPAWASCGSGLACANVYAPLDWGDPQPEAEGERIVLHLVKHEALSGRPLGTVFVNPGGPGSSGASIVLEYAAGIVGQPVLENFDVIGWDPRGVGQSSAVTCADDAGLDAYLYGVGDPEADGANLEFGSDEWINAMLEDGVAFGEACAADTGALLGHVDTLSTVHDLEMLRSIVGDPKLNYLGYSYGTQIGALYADTYPASVGRLVLDGAVDPASTAAEVTRAQAVGIEGAMRAYVAHCLAREGCPVGGGAEASGAAAASADVAGVDRGMADIAALLAAVEAQPIRAADGRMLYDSTLFTAMVATLYSTQLWPELDRIIVEVAEGRAEQAFRLADHYNDRVGGVYQSNLMEAFSAINCLDYPRTEADELDFDAMRAAAAELSVLAPVAGRYMSFGEAGCVGWPVPAVDGVARTVSGAGADPILVIGTTGDPATPFHWAESLAAQLESGVLVTYRGEGHTAYGESACIDAIVDDYFVAGAVPGAGDAVC